MLQARFVRRRPWVGVGGERVEETARCLALEGWRTQQIDVVLAAGLALGKTRQAPIR